MKKALLFSLAGAVSLNATISDDEILSIYGARPVGINIKVTERLPVTGLKNMEAIVVEISQDKIKQEEILFSDGNLIYMDIVDPKNRIIYRDQLKQERINKALSKAYKSENKDNIIKIGNDTKKPTMLVLTDAECPFCRNALSDVENTLKTHNIEIIMTSVHGDSGHAKSALIYKEIKNAKTDTEKITIMRKYYAVDNKSDAKSVSEAELNGAKAIAEKYFSLGVNSVPYMIETSKLK